MRLLTIRVCSDRELTRVAPKSGSRRAFSHRRSGALDFTILMLWHDSGALLSSRCFVEEKEQEQCQGNGRPALLLARIMPELRREIAAMVVPPGSHRGSDL